MLCKLAVGNPAGQLAVAQAGAAVLAELVLSEHLGVSEEALHTAAVLRQSQEAEQLLAGAGRQLHGGLG
jgi:hypothetical protein